MKIELARVDAVDARTGSPTSCIVGSKTASSRAGKRPGGAPALSGSHPTDKRKNLRVRVPAAPGNRSYLRALREAEMAAWHTPVRAREAMSAQASELVRTVAAVSGTDAKERALYAIVATVAAAAVIYGLWNTVQLSQHWGTFVELVRKLIG